MLPLLTYLVEDSVLIRDSLVAALEELGPVRVVGSSGEVAAALAWLGDPRRSVNLVIVDLFLRTGSGLDVLAALQSSRPHLHLVVLSNYATEPMRRRCLELGAGAVFDKSREIDALIAHCYRLAQRPRSSPRTGAAPSKP